MKAVVQPNPLQAHQFFCDKLAFTGPVELHRRISKGDKINVIDVREPRDFDQGHVPGAKNLPRSKWKSEEGLSWDKVNILYCYSAACHLAATAAVEFTRKGFPVMEMDGGFDAWKKNHLPVEK
jgi:rhodanese-related sulfurtransferase